jgi:hypothetical protein
VPDDAVPRPVPDDAEPDPVPDDGLWHCPHCGHGFVSANIWHSCTRIDVDEALARTTPAAREAFAAFVALVERCGPVVVVAQKTRIVLMVEVRFAGVSRIRRDSIRLTFALSRRVDLPWIAETAHYSSRWIAHGFDARSPVDLDHPELPELLCESYRDLGERGSLRLRRPGRDPPRDPDLPTDLARRAGRRGSSVAAHPSRLIRRGSSVAAHPSRRTVQWEMCASASSTVRSTSTRASG